MMAKPRSRRQGQKMKVDWAKESVLGAMVSAAFTAMASNSGLDGVVAASAAARIHDFMILCGITMAMVCGLSAVVLIVYQAFEDMARKTVSSAQGGWGLRSFGNLQTAKFLKIFLP